MNGKMLLLQAGSRTKTAFEGGNDMELKHHPEEWFFLHNFDADRVFNTIQRADYLIL